MPYRISIQPPALKQLEKLDRQVREKISSAIGGLSDNPRPPGYKKLTGRTGFRIHVGPPYVVIYDVDDGARLVEILKVGHRREVYR
jgi:mRNA interferase RelE/StbE